MPTLTDVVAPEPPQAPAKRAAAAPAAPTPNYYCVESSHDPRLLTEGRMFYYGGDDCPTCPVCGRQVSAQMVGVNARGQPQIPPGLLELASRLGERV